MRFELVLPVAIEDDPSAQRRLEAAALAAGSVNQSRARAQVIAL